MHYIYFTFFYLFLSNSSSAMEPQLRLHEEQGPDFALDNEFLKAGNIQYFSLRYEGSELKKLAPELRALDVQGHLKKKHVQLIFYKFAYILPFKANAVFELGLYGNNDFMLASNSRLTALKFLNPKNALEQEHSFPSVKGFPGMTIYSLEHFEAGSKLKDIERSCLDAIAPLYERKLDTPRTMVTKTTSSNQKELLGGMTYTSYYPFGDQTLVVSYKFATLEPGLKLKFAFGTGIAQYFLKNESDALIESVKRSRQYIQNTQKNMTK